MYIIFLHGNTVSTKIYSTAKFYISISYHKDLLSIDTRIFTPSRTMFFNAFRLHIKKTSAAIPSSAAGAGRLPAAYDRSDSGEVPHKARLPQNCQDSGSGYH